MKIINHLSESRNSLAVLFAITIISMTVPYGFPLFGVLAFVFVLFQVFYAKLKIRINLGFILFFLSILFYIIGLMWSGTIYSRNSIEINNIVGYILIWILLSGLEKKDYKPLLHKFATYAAFITFFVSVFSFFKFYSLLNGIQFQWLFMDDFYPPNTSLTRDYNTFSLGLMIGSIAALYMLSKATKALPIAFYLTTIVLSLSSVFFAGSRRGWVVIAFISIILLYNFLKFLMRSLKNQTKLIKSTAIVAYGLVFIFLFTKLFGIEINVDASYEIDRLKTRFETLQLENADHSFSQRTDRWDYAFDLMAERNISQMALGAGFDYLPKYAQVFAPEIEEDYPHNPFISAMLYSGLLGVVPVFLLFAYSVYKMIQNRKLLSVLPFIYIITWFYVFISYNSIFAVDIFVMLMLLMVSIPPKNKTNRLAST